MRTIGDALTFRLKHDDLTQYNAVQKMLYLGVMAVGVLIVISGLALWKPVQFSELAALFYSFQTIRLVHFLCMAAIVGFVVIHVSLALLVPQSLVAMVTGGPAVDARRPAPTRRPKSSSPIRASAMFSNRTPSIFRPGSSRTKISCASIASWSPTSTAATCCAVRSASAR